MNDSEQILSNLSPEDINDNMNYGKLGFHDVLKECVCINTFIMLNLYNILDKLYWFLYLSISKLTETDINNLFIINKSKKAITLTLFNQKKNDKNHYDFGFDDNDYPLPSYRKKFITLFILKNNLQIFNEHIANLNTQNKYCNKPLINILTEYEITTIVENKKDEPILIYDDDNKPVEIFYRFTYAFNDSFKSFTTNIREEIKSEYVGILMYEEAINTSTDLIKILHDSLGL